MTRNAWLSGLVALALAVPSVSVAQSPVSEAEARELGVEAYVYFYPLVTMEVTRRLSTNAPADAKPGAGPMNAFHHMRAYPAADFRDVVRPNFDTLYSTTWLDLTKEPQVVSMPDTAGRYYLLPMLDMWTDVFAVPGARTSGTKAGAFAVVPPGWKGTLPKGVGRIDAPTPYVWIIGRTQTNGPKDYDAVHAVQDGFVVTPLSRWGKKAAPPAKFTPDATVDMKTPPMVQVNTMPAAAYFALAANLMAKHPPHLTDWSTLARLRRLGFEPGKPFDLAKAPDAVRAGLEAAPAAGLTLLKTQAPTLSSVVNGWRLPTEGIGVYGNGYLRRAVIAMIGLGANPPDDAIYPVLNTDAAGKPMVGEGRYVIHFDKSALPPVGAFWSVTMYDAEGFQVANPLNRFALGDRDPLKFNADGSLDLYLQATSPGADKEANWLPGPAKGPIGVTLRLYAPKPEALDGRWVPPPVKRLP